MIRSQMNENTTFAATVSAYTKEIEASLGQRRKEMAETWDDLDQGWKDLTKRMAELGITTPSASNEGLVQLNVGGSHVNVRRSVLEAEKDSSAAWTLGRVFEGVWDKRLPRDSDGRIVLDESPACVKHLIHILLQRSGTGTASLSSSDDFAVHEAPYLHYVARALGLSGLCPQIGMVVEGGSTALEPSELGPMSVILRGWCPFNPDRLELVYRASRDGWKTADFHAKCGDDSPCTITLIRVKSQVTDSSDSVVGGFSSVPWAPTTQARRAQSPGAFLFMLKDGNMGDLNTFRPTKWGIKRGHARNAVSHSLATGPCFGSPPNLRIHRDANHRLQTNNTSYDIPEESSFVRLDGQSVTEREVFRVSNPSSAPPAKRAKVAGEDLVDLTGGTVGAVSTGDRSDDADKFGKAIAGALMEERVALQQAQADLKQADMRATQCATALEQLYGPDAAAGKGDDAVVELSVRGTRMTTLRSTLQACPESAFAARFDAKKWPATEKDVDGEGWLLVDCSPSVFSKVLDVLRMRIRASWAEDDCEQAGEGTLVRVEIKAGDRPSFDQFVNMYFPGCENFIMDCVESPKVSKAGP